MVRTTSRAVTLKYRVRFLPEARANLREAVTLVLKANRTLVQEDLAGADVIREPLKV